VSRARQKQLRYLRKTGRPTLIEGDDLVRVQRKVRSFHAKGMSYRAMGRQVGMPFRTVSEVLENSSVLRRTWEPLMALRFVPPSGRELISALGTERRLGALWRDGFSMDWLAVNHPEVLCRSQIQKTLRGYGKGLVTATVALRVEELYRKLETADPADFGIPARSVAYCRTFAQKKGYAPRGCWDEDTIDDPKAIPEWTGACGTAEGLRIHQREGIPACPPCLAVNLGPAAGAVPLNPAKLKAAREARRLTLPELGKTLGVHESTIHYWETGRSAPRSRSLVDRYLAVLDLCPEEAV
jgi:hypothetical protein